MGRVKLVGDASEIASTDVAWRRRKEHRRPEILLAARALIEEEGAAGVTMARIAEAAGVSEATVYKYFESKQNLVNQVLREWATPFIDRLTDELASLKGFRPRLMLIAVSYMRSLAETPRLHRVFFREIRWSNYRSSPMRALNMRFTAQMTETVEDAIRSGEADLDTQPEIIRDMLFGGLEHIAIRTIFAEKTINIERETALCVDRMLRGISPRESEGDLSAEIARLSRLVDRLEAHLLPPKRT